MRWPGAVRERYVTSIARDSLRAQGIDARQVEVDPTLLNSVLWRVTVMTPQSYLEGYYSLLDSSRNVAFSEHARGAALYERLRGDWNVARVAWFTHGFFKMEEHGGRVFITDLRLGMDRATGSRSRYSRSAAASSCRYGRSARARGPSPHRA